MVEHWACKSSSEGYKSLQIKMKKKVGPQNDLPWQARQVATVSSSVNIRQKGGQT